MNLITKLVCSAAALSSIFTLTPFAASAEDVTEVPETTAIISSENTVLESTLSVSSDSKDTTISVDDSAEHSKNAETTEKSELPSGNGVLLEDVPDDNVKRQFLTIQSKNGNTFYIIVDKDNEGRGNVYFMNLVDEYDLMDFADKFPDEDKNGNKKKMEIVTMDTDEETPTEAANEDDHTEDEQTTTVTNPTKAVGKNLLVPIIGIFGIIGGSACYFFKVKGASAKNDKKNEYDEEDDDFDNGETVKDDD